MQLDTGVMVFGDRWTVGVSFTIPEGVLWDFPGFRWSMMEAFLEPCVLCLVSCFTSRSLPTVKRVHLIAPMCAS